MLVSNNNKFIYLSSVVLLFCYGSNYKHKIVSYIFEWRKILPLKNQSQREKCLSIETKETANKPKLNYLTNLESRLFRDIILQKILKRQRLLVKSLDKLSHYFKVRVSLIEDKLWLNIMLKEELFIWRQDNFSKHCMTLEQLSDLMGSNLSIMLIEPIA